MQLTSTVFQYGESIPQPYTCLGPNVNPPLQIHDVPEEAQSLVLIFEDVDATPKAWTHWMLFDIPPDTSHIDENTIPPGATEGLANNHSHGYEGPCPKYFKGTHHYWFRLYALDVRLNLPAATEREEVEQKMKDHVVAEATLLGLCVADETVSADA